MGCHLSVCVKLVVFGVIWVFCKAKVSVVDDDYITLLMKLKTVLGRSQIGLMPFTLGCP